MWMCRFVVFFFFQAEDGIRDIGVTGVQTCALPIWTRQQEADGGTGAPFDGQIASATGGRRGVRQIPLARQPRPESQRARDGVIVVDSSVWIDFLNGRNAPHVRRLRGALGTDEVIVGDLMLCEVLQGLDSERAAQEVEALLRRFEIVPMAGDAIAVA